jgi:hypothetical protein
MCRFIRGRGVFAMTLVVVALGGATSGCGGDDDGNDDGRAIGLEAAAAKTPPAVPAPPPPIRKASPKWSTADWGDGMRANSAGMLVKPDGGEIRGWGDRRVRRYVTALFARMQYDFLTGDMAAVCKHVDPSLSSIPFSGDRPCRPMLRTYARQLERQKFEPSFLRFLWVRTYPGVAGIWVEDRRGERFRVPFGQQDNGAWGLELRELAPTEALAMPLQVKQPAAR